MKILFVGAHYDDIELSVGGTIAKFIQQGHEVYIIIVSKSDYTDYNNKILRSSEQAVNEGFTALKILGIPTANIIPLYYPTKEVPFNKFLIEDINREIDNIKPDLIITHHYFSDSHQDHINTAKAVLSASRYQKNIWFFETLYPAKLSIDPFKSLIYINITDTFDKKLESIKAHTSQIKKYPEWIKYVTALNTVRGIENQCMYAETFYPIKMEYLI
jgi:LmbE family N-acetylglucosaminyl deacetylase